MELLSAAKRFAAEPPVAGVSDTRPAARWEARDKIGSESNSATLPRSEGEAG